MRATPRGARIARVSLVLAIVVGAQALWLVVPAATLWLLAKMFDSTEEAFFAAMVAVPAAIILLLYLLGVMNRRYLRIVGRGAGRGPLEAILPATIVLFIIAASVWFVFFANHAPRGPEQVIP